VLLVYILAYHTGIASPTLFVTGKADKPIGKGFGSLKCYIAAQTVIHVATLDKILGFPEIGFKSKLCATVYVPLIGTAQKVVFVVVF
jgi:hypothetical protein